MKHEGIVTQITDLQEFKSGAQRRDFILHIPGKYPKDICVVCWGKMIPYCNELMEGEKVKVDLDIVSKEYNGKWYTEAKAIFIESVKGGGVVPGKADNADLFDDGLPF